MAKGLLAVLGLMGIVLISACTSSSPSGQTIANQPQQTCTPNWDCTDWSGCINKQQTRNCIDINNCGTVEGKPIESQSCTPKCSLGYLNEYQCSGKWRQQKYQYSDCYTSWSNVEYCSYGCENGGCKPKPTISEPTVKHCVEVTNFHYDAEGNDNYNLNDEYVTLRNNCSESLDMTSWIVKDYEAKHTYVFSSFILGSGNTVTLYSGIGTDTSTELYWGRSYGAIWNNDGDILYLKDNYANLVLTYSY